MMYCTPPEYIGFAPSWAKKATKLPKPRDTFYFDGHLYFFLGLPEARKVGVSAPNRDPYKKKTRLRGPRCIHKIFIDAHIGGQGIHPLGVVREKWCALVPAWWATVERSPSYDGICVLGVAHFWLHKCLKVPPK